MVGNYISKERLKLRSSKDIRNLTLVGEHNLRRMVAEEEHSDVDNQRVATVDIDRAEVSAFVAVDVDAYDVIDDDNLVVDAHVGVVSLPLNLDRDFFRHLSVYRIPPRVRDYVDDATGEKLS